MKYRQLFKGQDTLLRTDEFARVDADLQDETTNDWMSLNNTMYELDFVGSNIYRRRIDNEPKKPNPESLRRAIQDLPICAEGKSKVTKLVEEITGAKITSEKSYRVSQRFHTARYGELILVCPASGKVVLISLRDGCRINDMVRVTNVHRITEVEFNSIASGIGGEITPVS